MAPEPTIGNAGLIFVKLSSANTPQASPGDIPQALIAGDAELGVFLLNVLLVPGVDIVGPFPPDLQQEFLFRSAIATSTRNALAAKAFVDFLRSPAARAIITSQGMTPG